MYRRILVPLDGSPFAEHALPYAAQVARRSDARVDLALVHTSYSVATMDAAIHETVDRWQTEQRVREASYLHSVAANLRLEYGVHAEPVLLTGTIVGALAAHVTQAGVDLVVMTTHGRGGLERAWLGSVADALIRHVHVPVLLVRPSDTEPRPNTAGALFRHVVIALDGSPLGEHSLASVLPLIDERTHITLIRVVAPPRGPSSVYLPHAVQLNRQLLTEREREAHDYLEVVTTRLRAQHENTHSCVLVDAHPATAIVRWADEHGADGIGVSTHGRAPALRLLLGSVTDQVIRGGTVPVLVG